MLNTNFFSFGGEGGFFLEEGVLVLVLAMKERTAGRAVNDEKKLKRTIHLNFLHHRD